MFLPSYLVSLAPHHLDGRDVVRLGRVQLAHLAASHLQVLHVAWAAVVVRSRLSEQVILI
jgi:hypothetical protein